MAQVGQGTAAAASRQAQPRFLGEGLMDTEVFTWYMIGVAIGTVLTLVAIYCIQRFTRWELR